MWKLDGELITSNLNLEKLADRILGWGEALDCHEQSDPLNAWGRIIVEIAPVAFDFSCKGTEPSMTA